MPGPSPALRSLNLRVLAGPWAGQVPGRSRRRRDQNRTPRHRRRHACLGAALRGRRDSGAHLFPPPTTTRSTGASPRFRSISKNAEDRGRRLMALVREEADVLIENFKVGWSTSGTWARSMPALGRDEPAPCLVLDHRTSARGRALCEARRATISRSQAMGGIMDLTGELDGQPQQIGVAFADAFIGTSTPRPRSEGQRLKRAIRTGMGPYRHESARRAGRACSPEQGAMNYLCRRHDAAPASVMPIRPWSPYQSCRRRRPRGRRGGQRQPVSPPLRTCWRPSWSTIPFRANADRVVNRSALAALIEEYASLQPTRAYSQREKAGVPCGPINDIAQVFADPRVKHRKMRVILPEEAEGGVTIPGVRTPINMSATPLRTIIRRRGWGEAHRRDQGRAQGRPSTFRAEKKVIGSCQETSETFSAGYRHERDARLVVAVEPRQAGTSSLMRGNASHREFSISRVVQACGDAGKEATDRLQPRRGAGEDRNASVVMGPR